MVVLHGSNISAAMINLTASADLTFTINCIKNSKVQHMRVPPRLEMMNANEKVIETPSISLLSVISLDRVAPKMDAL